MNTFTDIDGFCGDFVNFTARLSSFLKVASMVINLFARVIESFFIFLSKTPSSLAFRVDITSKAEFLSLHNSS